MKNPIQRVRSGGLILAIVLVVAVCGYTLMGHSLFDSFYLFVITVSSVGFGEESSFSDQEKLLTMFVIVGGLSAVAYTFGGFVQMVFEGEVERALGHRKVAKGIGKLSDHVLICGYGRNGQILSQELVRQSKPFVIIDMNSDVAAEAFEHDYLVVIGDATEEEVLLAAGVDRAAVIVTGLPDDAANVFITLTARNLNPDLQIIARAERVTTQKKLKQAGANRIVMPATMGAQRMARMITRPNTADLMDLFADHKILDVELDEILIPAGNDIVGTTVRDTEMGRRHQLLVVAVKGDDGSMIFNPSADHAFKAHDTIILMGRTEDVNQFRTRHDL